MQQLTGDVMDRVHAVLPVLAAQRERSDRDGRLPAETLEACRSAGLFGLCAPVEVGGEEAPLPVIFQATQAVAAIDPSVAWYVVNSAACARAAAWIDPDHWSQIYRQPLGNFGFSAAPTGRLRAVQGEDSFVLSGSWPLMTGVLDAEWAAVMCMLRRPGERSEPRQVLIPTASLTVTEVWQNAVAMRGTASHEVTTNECAVPAGLVMDQATPSRIDRPLYRGGNFLVASALNAAVPVGILRASVDAASEELRAKVSSIFGREASHDAALLEMMAEAANAADYLDRAITGALSSLWTHLQGQNPPPAELRALVVGAPFHAVGVARELISRLYARSSRQAFFAGHPLERALRDIHAVAYGLETLRPLQHDAGRIAINADPLTPGF